MAATKELIFGTGNPAKVAQVRGALEPIGITVRSIDEFDLNMVVSEDGDTARENARLKAVAYAGALGKTVFAMDNALYFKDLPNDQQPGLLVRRLGGQNRSTDQEMVEAYSELVRLHGGEMEAWWEFGISIAQPDGTSVEDSIISHRLFVAKPSPKSLPGYPLESIQVVPETGQYISEMTEIGQAAFWQKAIGTELATFVKANL